MTEDFVLLPLSLRERETRASAWVKVLVTALLVFAGAAAGAHAQEPLARWPLSSNPAQALGRFEPLTFPKTPEHTRYLVTDEGVRAVAEGGASGLMARFEAAPCPALTLRWRWKIEQAPENSGAPGKGGDDYAARMVAVFDYDPALYQWWERLARLLVSEKFKSKIPGAALEYVWAPTRKSGARWDNPYTAKAKMIAVSGKPGAWSEHTADLCADYRRAFGRAPTKLVGIFLMSDADNSKSTARAVFGDVELVRATDQIGK